MNYDTLITFLNEHATIDFKPLEEYIPVRGNAMASGDKELDRKLETEINDRLNNDDLAAWFCAHVTATFLGFKGEDYLGACSYESFDEFKKDACYASMVDTAIDDLATKILANQKAIARLNTILKGL